MTPLHHIGNALRDLLLLLPLSWVRLLFIGLLCLVLLWVLLLPKKEVVPEGESNYSPNNLKIWASVALLLQIVIYSVI